jgi:hypothetical protein
MMRASQHAAAAEQLVAPLGALSRAEHHPAGHPQDAERERHGGKADHDRAVAGGVDGGRHAQ